MKADIQTLRDYRTKYNSDFLKFSGVKDFLDGTASMHTGTLIEPYSDQPGFNAEPLVNIEKTIEKAILLDKEGFRIRFHACGAGAVRLGLDIFEEVRRSNGFSDTRHTIEHIENIHPEDIPRFKKLAVTASVQPDHLWADTFAGHPFHKILGKDRCRWAWPFKSLIDSGADVAFGTDFPISPLNPMQGLYRAISRLHEDGLPLGGWNPKEKLSLAESITAYTAGSSKQMYAENLKGMLKPGMVADIAVVKGNLFEMSADEIRHAKIYMTLSNGKIIKKPIASD
jgi:predicted amidohydrolase YtcJ